MYSVNFNLYFDPEEIQIDNPESSTENSSEGLSTDVSSEVTTEVSTVPEDSIITDGYEFQYSDIEFLAPFDEETSEYVTVVNDNRPYMSSEVTGASINDIYTMVLSIRNIVLLWFLVWFLLKMKAIIHNSVAKYMGRGE